MHTITLTDNEILTVIAALHACAPFGGGSAPFTLANRLTSETGKTPTPESIGTLANGAICNLLDYYENENAEQLGNALRIYSETGQAPAAIG